MFASKKERDAAEVRRVLQGDPERFGVLVERYLPGVMALTAAHLRNMADAEDAAQEAFLRAYRSLPNLREPRDFGAWLFTIARNASRGMIRGRIREDRAVEAIAANDAALPRSGDDELRQSVRERIDALQSDHREALLLHYYAGLTSAEMGRSLGISPAAARKRLQRAREALGEAMSRELAASLPGTERLKERGAKIMGAVGALGVVWEAQAAVPAAAALTVASLLPSSKLAIGAAVGIAATLGFGWYVAQQAEDSPIDAVEVQLAAQQPAETLQPAAQPTAEPTPEPTPEPSAGSAPDPQSEPTQPASIEVGMFSAPPESVPWLRQEIEAFQQQYPHIEVTVKGLDAPVRRRFQTHDEYFGADPESVMAANVTGIDSQFVYIGPYFAERGLIVPIEEFDTPNDSFSLSAFPAPLLRMMEFEGATWGVPWLSRDPVLVIDWELFENAGFYEPPRTWQEFIEIASALTRDTNGDGTIDQWGVGFRTTDDTIPSMFLSMVIQQGDGIMREGIFLGGDQAIADAVRFMHNLNGPWRMAKDDGRSLSARLADPSVRYAMHLEMNHTLGEAVNDPRLRLVPMPSLDGQPKTFSAHRRYFAIRPSTPAQEFASWEFVKWMTRRDISIPNELAGFPVRTDFTSRSDFQARMAGKIQRPELIFDSCQTAVLTLDRTLDLTPAVERFWQTLVPAFSDPSKTAVSLERARDAANQYLGEYWYPYQ